MQTVAFKEGQMTSKKLLQLRYELLRERNNTVCPVFLRNFYNTRLLTLNFTASSGPIPVSEPLVSRPSTNHVTRYTVMLDITVNPYLKQFYLKSTSTDKSSNGYMYIKQTALLY